MRNSRWIAGLVLLAFLVSACASAAASDPTPTEPSDPPTSTTKPTEVESQSPSESTTPEPVEETPTATSAHNESDDCGDPFEDVDRNFSIHGWETNFCKHSVPFSEIFSGGPPRDGIPPIDDPRFVSVQEADEWLEDVEPIILFGLEDDVRAYPLQIMTWHEIVNDFVSDQPVVVTFCPLCNTALVFRRPEVNGELLTFGTSGNLRNSDLVMWDRQTESWWQQFSGEAIVGDLTGSQLEFLPASIVSWSDFLNKYPDAQVLSKDTGFRRDYGRNPYTGYDSVNNFPFLYYGDIDGRLPSMARVLGVLSDDGMGIAYSYDQLEDEMVINDTLSEEPIVAFWKSGTASALDSGTISDGRDIGTTGVFQRTVDGQVLTFEANGDGTFSDQETGTTWDIVGQALDGPLAGKSLTPISHHDTFWFAWAAFVNPESLEE